MAREIHDLPCTLKPEVNGLEAGPNCIGCAASYDTPELCFQTLIFPWTAAFRDDNHFSNRVHFSPLHEALQGQLHREFIGVNGISVAGNMLVFVYGYGNQLIML